MADERLIDTSRERRRGLPAAGDPTTRSPTRRTAKEAVREIYRIGDADLALDWVTELAATLDDRPRRQRQKHVVSLSCHVHVTYHPEWLVSALETCFLLARADVEVRRRLEVQGLSLNELAVLSQLAETLNRTRRRQDLADSLGMTPSGITRLLAPLEKLGYVTRVADPRDARLSLVVLTDGGTERTHDAVAEAEERATSLFDHAFDTNEQETLDALLAALVPFT